MKRFFLIGIGGSGMSSLAYMLAEKGCDVFGFDDKILKSQILHFEKYDISVLALEQVYKLNLQSFDCLVFSTAINLDTHKVCLLFKEHQVPILHRSEVLHFFFSKTNSISVSGTHGKTTTTGMISFILHKLDYKPQVMIGAKTQFLDGRGGCWGSGKWGVYESDESDGSFLKHDANIKILTNLDDDHLDYYKTKENLQNSFINFINQNLNSKVILNLTNIGLKNISKKLNFSNIISISTETLDYPSHVVYKIENKVLIFKKNQKVYKIELKVGGSHYLQNALCAILALEEAGIGIEESIKAIKDYPSVKRRFEFLGVKNKIAIYDDYGHHPTEIESVLESFSEKSRLIVLFQPHRYTRTKLFYKEFADALSKCDFLFLLPIYSSGEEKMEGIQSDMIANLVKCKYQILGGNIEEDVMEMVNYLKEGDTLLCLGAGNVYLWGQKILGV